MYLMLTCLIQTLSSFFFERSSSAFSFSCAAFFLSLSILFSSSSFLSLALSIAVDTSWLRSCRFWRHTSSSSFSPPFFPLEGGVTAGPAGPGPLGPGGWPGNGGRYKGEQMVSVFMYCFKIKGKA